MGRGPAAGAIAILLSACANSAPVAPASVAAPDVQPQPAAPVVPSPVPALAPNVIAEPAPAAPSPAEPAPRATGQLRAYLDELSSVSCPAGARRTSGESVELSAKTVPLQAINPSRKKVGELTFVGGFHLTSPDARFGGLSGLDVLDGGNLLAVTDQGDFVWIDLQDDGVTPKAARIAPMRDAGGQPLRGKAEGDSEGLAVNGGIALVSYERDHRVLAFDLGRCGAAARGAPIAFGSFGRPLAQAFSAAKIDVGANQGPEPLAVTRDWYLFTGIETKVGEESPLSARPIEAAPEFNLRVGNGAPEFVGLDVIETGRDKADVRAFSAHRGFSALSGNAIVLMETDFSRVTDQAGLPSRAASEIDERAHDRFRAAGSKTLASLNILFNVDNFEGLAARELPDGRVRLYLVSDDNFSKTQRTLLFVFETAT